MSCDGVHAFTTIVQKLANPSRLNIQQVSSIAHDTSSAFVTDSWSYADQAHTSRPQKVIMKRAPRWKTLQRSLVTSFMHLTLFITRL